MSLVREKCLLSAKIAGPLVSLLREELLATIQHKIKINDELFADLAAARKELEGANAALLAKLGDDYCWLDNLRSHPDFGKIPPKEEFLQSCAAYHSQIAEEKGVLPNCQTMRQLIEENAELKRKTKKT